MKYFCSYFQDLLELPLSQLCGLPAALNCREHRMVREAGELCAMLWTRHAVAVGICGDAQGTSV